MELIELFATNLKRKRMELNLSQEQLAELSGLHRTYISLVERKKRNITIKNIEKISKALNVEPNLLLKKREEKN